MGCIRTPIAKGDVTIHLYKESYINLVPHQYLEGREMTTTSLDS